MGIGVFERGRSLRAVARRMNVVKTVYGGVGRSEPSRVIEGPVFARAPRRIYWEVTAACDLACRHCRAEAQPHADPAELGTPEGLALIDRLAGFGEPLPQLVLTGGDPLKRADLWALIALARVLGFGVSVAPSATPLLTPTIVRRLRAAGVEAISLSLDGPDAARHDALRGVPGCFERTLAAATAARDAGLPFQVNTLVSRATLADLPAVHETVSRLGASRWSLFFLVTVGRGSGLQPIDARECEQLFDWLVETRRHGGPIIATTEAPHFRRILLQRGQMGTRRSGASGPEHTGLGVRDGNGIMFISHAGEVYPSGFLPVSVGSVRREHPVSIYREARIMRELRRPECFGGRCGRCVFGHVCGGSRARAYAATGDPFAEDPLCRYERS
jgi:radical SAM protein